MLEHSELGPRLWDMQLHESNLDYSSKQHLSVEHRVRLVLTLLRIMVATLSLFMAMCDLLVVILYTKPVLSYDQTETFQFTCSYPCRGCCVYDRTREAVETVDLLSPSHLPDDASSLASEATTVSHRNQFLAWLIGDPVARRTVSRHDQAQF
ncbi:hypothetical protein Ciccas_014264 [Cichlidogyrus casuarinus]|uniref:Uncharacterized protein n=1 Tax=Cichlidogyrus casuarinus TaxID=1844966 RepID=A0ABD2PKQ9_9PLAT